jgi:7,8-dihydropterin-6-yl-methyl-4-(beta-D-ribofuranosyl)aminobenzene 5'-phosphate synthase
MREGDALMADRYRDDMALVLQTGECLVLLRGCCHAGLLNTLRHVERTSEHPVAVIVGGLHLASATADDLRHIGDVLSAAPTLERVCPNHCTGEASFVALTEILGPSIVRTCPAGTILEF